MSGNETWIVYNKILETHTGIFDPRPQLTQYRLPGMSPFVIAVLSLLLVALHRCQKDLSTTVALFLGGWEVVQTEEWI